jgi:hypothetical protein
MTVYIFKKIKLFSFKKIARVDLYLLNKLLNILTRSLSESLGFFPFKLRVKPIWISSLLVTKINYKNKERCIACPNYLNKSTSPRYTFKRATKQKYQK